jgi:glucokinase
VTLDWRLLVDAGGTNVRFGRVAGTREIHDAVSLPARSFATFDDALEHYLGQLSGDLKFTTAAVAGAGPVGVGEIRLTNNSWCIRADAIARILGGDPHIRLVNDLEAVAYCLPHLDDDYIDWITAGPARPAAPQRMLAVNVGTGFGSACVIRSPHGWVACPSEAGHMTLGAVDDAELAIHAQIGAGPLTIEDVLSGDGIVKLRALLQKQGDDATQADAWFGMWLARACANLVLASASWDGVLLCGSVASAWWRSADFEAFQNAFAGTSAMRDRLRRTPIGLIQHDWPAFVGLSNLEIL